MKTPRDLSELVKKIFDQLPGSGSAGLSQAQSSVALLIQQFIEKLNLVTREEFEVQEKLLRKLQAEVIDLEARIDELQKKQKS